MYRLILPAVLLIAGSAALSADNGYRQKQMAEDNAKLAKILAGYTPGAPVNCIDTFRVRDSDRAGDKIIYRESAHRLYVTDTGGGCFGLRTGDAIITRSTVSQFCRGDILSTSDLRSNIPSGSCVFGDFVPYEK